MNGEAVKPIALSTAEFCRRYNVSRGTFYRERREGNLPTFHIRGKTMVLVEEADRWLQSHLDAA